MKKICIKRLIIGCASIAALVSIFAIAADKSEINDIEGLIYMMPCLIYAWFVPYFCIKE